MGTATRVAALLFLAATARAQESRAERRFREAEPESATFQRAARELAEERARAARNLLAEDDLTADPGVGLLDEGPPPTWERRQEGDAWTATVVSADQELLLATRHPPDSDTTVFRIGYLRIAFTCESDPEDTALTFGLDRNPAEQEPERTTAILVTEDQYHDAEGWRHPEPVERDRTVVRPIRGAVQLPDWHRSGTPIASIFTDGRRHILELVSSSARTALLVDGEVAYVTDRAFEHPHPELGLIALSHFRGRIHEILEWHIE